MDTNTRVQTLGETVCISNSTNILGRGVLSPALGKYYSRPSFSTLVWQPV